MGNIWSSLLRSEVDRRNGVQNTANGASKQLEVQVAARPSIYYNYGMDNSYINLQSKKKDRKPASYTHILLMTSALCM
jgi:hypothetical protein